LSSYSNITPQFVLVLRMSFSLPCKMSKRSYQAAEVLCGVILF